MKIKLATLNDIESISLLNHEFWCYNADLQHEYYKKAKESGDYPKNVIINEDSDIFLAVENDKIVGLIHVRESQILPYASIVQHKYAEVIDLIVTETYKRKCIGSLLINAAKKWSKLRNLDYLELFYQMPKVKLFFMNIMLSIQFRILCDTKYKYT